VVDSTCGKCGAPRSPVASDPSLCPACLLSIAFSETLADAEEDGDADLLPPGSVFGTFLIQRPLGRGGMGAVYEAVDTRLDRSVALKILPAEFLHDPTFARRFDSEARLAARLEHPNIVPIYASGIEDGIPWMSMRLLAGKNLSALLQDRRLTAAESLALLKQVAAALDHAHAFGVVHRDIKPANILLDRNGVASVADFGLAQLMDSGARLTRTGMLSGTPHYMAPEQALGQRVDQRCDVYALGIVAYEMLVGRTPFGGESPVAVLLQQVHEPLPTPGNQALPAEWMKPIQKATAKNPAERWPSAGAFVQALASSIAVAPIVQNAALALRLRAGSLRTRVVAAAAVFLAIAALVWMLVRSPDPPPPGPAVATVREPGPVQPPDTPVPTPIPTPVPNDEPPPDGASSTGAGAKPSPTLTPAPVSPSPPGPGPDTEAPAPLPPPPPPLIVVEGIRGLESLPRLPGLVPPALPQDEIVVPEPVERVTALYPAAATAAKIEGNVTVSGTVDVRGHVTDVKLVWSSHKVFEEAAIEAFKKDRYKPARRNGVAVPHPVTRTFQFTLKKN
jgi:TonB family protein